MYHPQNNNQVKSSYNADQVVLLHRSLLPSLTTSFLFMLVPGPGCFPVIQHLLLPKSYFPYKAWRKDHHIHKLAGLKSVSTLCPRAQYMYLYNRIYL